MILTPNLAVFHSENTFCKASQRMPCKIFYRYIMLVISEFSTDDVEKCKNNFVHIRKSGTFAPAFESKIAQVVELVDTLL